MDSADIRCYNNPITHYMYDWHTCYKKVKVAQEVLHQPNCHASYKELFIWNYDLVNDAATWAATKYPFPYRFHQPAAELQTNLPAHQILESGQSSSASSSSLNVASLPSQTAAIKPTQPAPSFVEISTSRLLDWNAFREYHEALHEALEEFQRKMKALIPLSYSCTDIEMHGCLHKVYCIQQS